MRGRADIISCSSLMTDVTYVESRLARVFCIAQSPQVSWASSLRYFSSFAPRIWKCFFRWMHLSLLSSYTLSPLERNQASS